MLISLKLKYFFFNFLELSLLFYFSILCTYDKKSKATFWGNDTQNSYFNQRNFENKTLNEEFFLSEKSLKEKIINEIKPLINSDIKPINYFSKKFISELLFQASELFKQLPNIAEIQIDETKNITIVGDIHGQLFDLLYIFEENGFPSQKNNYLFNGDFVDRGSNGLECLIILLYYKLLYPKDFFLTRGNHESLEMNKRYGFYEEIQKKLGVSNYNDDEVLQNLVEFYYSLPLGYKINQSILVVHGGIPTHLSENKISQINKINRFEKYYINPQITEILWNDPVKHGKIRNSPRGSNIYLFPPNIVNEFLKENGLNLLIRSHQKKEEGFEKLDNLITVFSASNYEESSNKGAYINLYQKNNSLDYFIKQFP